MWMMNIWWRYGSNGNYGNVACGSDIVNCRMLVTANGRRIDFFHVLVSYEYYKLQKLNDHLDVDIMNFS